MIRLPLLGWSFLLILLFPSWTSRQVPLSAFNPRKALSNWILIEETSASAFRTWIGVTRQASSTILRQLFCITANLSTCFSLAPFRFFRVYQIGAANISIRVITALQTSLIFQRVTPYIDADIQAKALFQLTIFAFVFTRYSLQRIFVSTYNPSTLITGFSQIETVPSLTVTVRFTFFGFLVRCTRLYFAGANVTLYIAAYLAYLRYAFSRIQQFLSIDLLQARRWISSIKPSIYTRSPNLLYPLIRGVLKNRNRIENTSNPQGIPVLASSIGLILRPRVIDITLFLRKLAIYYIIRISIPFALRLQSSLSYKALSNTLVISSKSRLAILAPPILQTIQTISVINSSTVLTDHSFRAPICSSSRNLLASAYSRIRIEMTASSVFLSVSNSVISLYAFGSEQSGFYSFFKIIVLASLNGLG